MCVCNMKTIFVRESNLSSAMFKVYLIPKIENTQGHNPQKGTSAAREECVYAIPKQSGATNGCRDIILERNTAARPDMLLT